MTAAPTAITVTPTSAPQERTCAYVRTFWKPPISETWPAYVERVIANDAHRWILIDRILEYAQRGTQPPLVFVEGGRVTAGALDVIAAHVVGGLRVRAQHVTTTAEATGV